MGEVIATDGVADGMLSRILSVRRRLVMLADARWVDRFLLIVMMLWFVLSRHSPILHFDAITRDARRYADAFHCIDAHFRFLVFDG